MGKYDKVLPGLPKPPVSDAPYQQRVQEYKDKVEDKSATALGLAYARLRSGASRWLAEDEAERLIHNLGYDGLKALESLVNLRIAAYEQLLAESQDEGADGWGTYGVKPNALRLASGDTIRVQREPYGKVMDKEKFRQWCVANGYERQLQLWPSTMNALVKERLLAGEEPPEGCEAFGVDKVVFVPAGGE
jgi:hypothetical protein